MQNLSRALRVKSQTGCFLFLALLPAVVLPAQSSHNVSGERTVKAPLAGVGVLLKELPQVSTNEEGRFVLTDVQVMLFVVFKLHRVLPQWRCR